MNDRWMVRGREFSNCNCDWGCPCQFNAPSTHGHCEAIGSGIVDEGYFNDTSLDGLHWALLLQWPGEISAGNGTQQAIIDERATPQQRESLRRILHGEATKPGATGFYVYNSTMSTVLETLFAPVTVEVDVEGRRASILVPGLIESSGTPIIDPLSGQEHRAGISLPDGFEYTFAEMGSGSTRSSAAIALELKDSYGQFNYMHLTQDGVIR
ncbi:DUF1326 domain-containing protein [Synechococcus sp. EJ6-Ellesmere]|uniref:DUF1326 domain-containing protein n=1 Tax=Synechococcus sp. EJ6-Ellesmere TaxID=2823734 RepID=UPI0020CF2AB7|nr:DUF1326 domain-containing protein [Synechococcus sp. EJ6-Ellesmere]MCP9825489.1 DUF1326 domain-containing protein [Synechococcus sp. EJ6-Ellesmere]